MFSDFFPPLATTQRGIFWSTKLKCLHIIVQCYSCTWYLQLKEKNFLQIFYGYLFYLYIFLLIYKQFQIFTFFYINIRKYRFRANFRFLMKFHALGCPEHDLTISGKCLSVCVCDKNFVSSVTQELINRI